MSVLSLFWNKNKGRKKCFYLNDLQNRDVFFFGYGPWSFPQNKNECFGSCVCAHILAKYHKSYASLYSAVVVNDDDKDCSQIRRRNIAVGHVHIAKKKNLPPKSCSFKLIFGF